MAVVTQAQANDPSRKPSKTEDHPLYKVTRSDVHGWGAFATRDIKKGEVIDEYLGDRISHAQADKRYEDHDENDNHTFLFIVDKKTVIDAGVGGNDARFINHKCDPNCESEIKKGRVFIVATRKIAKGEEIGYDYQIGREKDDPENVDEIYACRCGSPKCRGTMLWPAKRPSPKKRKKKSAARKNARSAASRSSAAKRGKKGGAGKKTSAGKKTRAGKKSKARKKK